MPHDALVFQTRLCAYVRECVRGEVIRKISLHDTMDFLSFHGRVMFPTPIKML